MDTSILARLANVTDTLYPVATKAVVTLHRQGEILHVAPQNLVEFRNVATRPANVNGLGLSPAMAESQAATFETVFPLLTETPDIYPAWKLLVQTVGVVGKQVHDARLVAICQVYSVTHILTFNAQHFVRLAAYGPGLTITDPVSV